MTNCKPKKTHLPLGHPLYRERVALFEIDRQEMKSISYRSVLGSLMCLSTRTRHDVSTAVSMIGKYQADPSMQDWKAMKYVLRYLKGIGDFGINVQKDTDESGLIACSDVDWARDELNLPSRYG